MDPLLISTSPPTPASVPYASDKNTLLPRFGVTLFCVKFEPVDCPVSVNRLSLILN